ncbi:MAG: class I tRNA ligase family protein [Vulcanimicrobiota bacterium]
MFVRKFDLEKFHSEYNVKCRDMYPWPEIDETPFGATWAVVSPGGNTEPHSHELPETFFIVEGEGEMDIDGQRSKVGVGDVVYLPATSTHTIHNLSPDNRLVFLSVYWDDDTLKAARAAANGGASGSKPPSAKRRLVISAPPTPNGKLHLGHLSGPYLGADIYRRYSALRGVPTFHLCGADDHQSYTCDKANTLGQTPEQTADHFGQAVEATLKKAGVDLEMFLYPRKSPKYTQFVQAVFKKLLGTGKLLVKEAPTLYCEQCQRHLYEVWVMGACPHCGTHCMGNGCEECGLPNDCTDLGKPVCSVCNQTPVTRTVKRCYFPLEQSRPILEEYYAAMKLPLRLRAVVSKLMAKGLPDAPVTHVSDWGIPVPDEQFPGQIISVWLEMVLGYLFTADVIAKTNQLPKNFWDDPEAEVVQFFGCDNAFYYTVLFPAVMRAVSDRIVLPHAFCTNEHYQFGGSKFSTSRQHAVWVDDFLAHEPVDLVRFYLCYTRPEQSKTSFSHEDYAAVKQRELFDGWQAWLARLEARTGGQVPQATGLNAEQSDLYRHLQSRIHEVEAAYESEAFSPCKVARLLNEWVHEMADFGSSWDFLDGVEGAGEERNGALALELAAARSLAIMMAPIMPNASARLWKALGFRGRVREWDSQLQFLPAGEPLVGLGEVIPRPTVLV